MERLKGEYTFTRNDIERALNDWTQLVNNYLNEPGPNGHYIPADLANMDDRLVKALFAGSKLESILIRELLDRESITAETTLIPTLDRLALAIIESAQPCPTCSHTSQASHKAGNSTGEQPAT